MHKAEYFIHKLFDVSNFIPINAENINIIFCEYAKHGNGKRLTKSELRFSKKLIALSLVNFNSSLVKNFDADEEDKKYGFVYRITNPAFEKHVKIGTTKNPYKRLSTYQTYDPLRRFKIKSYDFFLNSRKIEKEVLREFKTDLSLGEWVQNDRSEDINRFIKRRLEIF